MCAYLQNPKNKSLYQEFYKTSFDIEKDMTKDYILVDSLKYSEIIWDKPEIFLELGFDPIITTYKRKYLKYKSKYLQLKNIINKKIVL